MAIRSSGTVLAALVVGVQISSLAVAVAAPALTPMPSGFGDKPWASLTVGECVLAVPPPGAPSFTTLPTVSCATPHEAEVFATTSTVFGDGAPEDKCKNEFEGYVGVPFEQSTYTFSWISATDPKGLGRFTAIICLVKNQDASPITGSVRQ